MTESDPAGTNEAGTGGGSEPREGSAGETAKTTGGTTVTTIWGFLTALVVIGALVGLTIVLAKHYKAAKDAATILGIVVPVFASVFGATLGYWTGNTTGTSQGHEQAKKEIKNDVKPKLDAAQQAVSNLVTKIRAEGTSQPGVGAFAFNESLPRPVTFDEEELSRARDTVADARSAVEAL